MVLFYVVAGAMALGVALVLARPLFRPVGSATSRDARDAELYRDQLAEIDRDLGRGAISPAEAEGARAEVSRRLLTAADRAEASRGLATAPPALSGLVAGLALIGAPAVALVVYLSVGAPGMPDRPLAARSGGEAATGGETRLSQTEAEAMAPPDAAQADAAPPEGMEEYAALIQRLERVVEERPGEAQGLELLANGYMRLGRHAEAWRAYDDLIEVLGEQAKAEHYAAMAEAMVLAAGGYVSPEAEQALAKALARQPGLPVARYYRGLTMAQGGRIDEAIAVWEKLKGETPPDAPWLEFLDRTLAEARALRGGGAGAVGSVAGSGPSAAEMAAAEAMSPEERQAMIEGMVSRLEERLTSEGGAPEEWLRLMRAYVQLDRPEEAERVASMGIAAFGSSSEADFLREQALLMGLEPE